MLADDPQDEPQTALPAPTILDGLTSLIDKSLLKQEQGSSGEPRLTMLETIREYALEQLLLSGETETLRRRHADYYLKLTETAEPQLHGPDQVAWSTRLEAEHDNLRAVLAWGCSIEDDQLRSLRLASALSWFWIIRSHYSEGHRWLNTLIDRHPKAAPAARAKLLRVTGMLAENHGEFASSIALLEESLALYRDLNDAVGAAEALLFLGRIKHWQGAYTAARLLLSESLALSQGQPNTWMSYIWSLQSLGNRHDIAVVYLDLGRLARTQGDVAQARTCYAESLTVFGEVMDRRGVPECIEGIAARAGMIGQPARATRLFSAANAWRQAVDLPLPPVYRTAYERDLVAVRRQLDEVAWATAWAEGQGLPFERTLREAEAILAL